MIYLLLFCTLDLLLFINGQHPEFTRNIPNLSIVKGKDAFLRCSISNLGENKIIWTHVDSQQLISIQEHVIENKNGRISIQVVGDSLDTLFELRINNISLEDRGYYMCQIQCLDNAIQTCTPKSQVGYLNVVVPPKFDESVLQSDSNVTIREFEDVSIPCTATGNPRPSIYWKREDIYLNEHNIQSNRLHIISANRQDSGVYICLASNGVQPSISRRINLIVEFAPMIRIVTQVLPVKYGDSVKLECQTESNPLADHYWLKETSKDGLIPVGDHISLNSISNRNSYANINSFSNSVHRKRHRQHNRDDISKRNQTNNRKYQVRLKKTIQFKYLFQLHIDYVIFEDTGQYICVVTNQLGEARSSIQLKVIERSSQNKSLSKDQSSKAPTTIKSTTRLFDYDVGNEISNTFRPEIRRKNLQNLNEEDNQIGNEISNQKTQLLKAKKNSSTPNYPNFALICLLFFVFIVIRLL